MLPIGHVALEMLSPLSSKGWGVDGPITQSTFELTRTAFASVEILEILIDFNDFREIRTDFC